MPTLALRPLRTTDTALYRFTEELLTKAFPPEEYRDPDARRLLADENPAFRLHAILDIGQDGLDSRPVGRDEPDGQGRRDGLDGLDGRPVGLLTLWDFEPFRFIEHFAILPALRNGGYGRRTLELLFAQSGKPHVLEVERPDTEPAARRIDFYRRSGFRLWEVDYRQPAYRPGSPEIPMYLMVRGDLQCERDYPSVRDRIRREVYGCTV